MTRRAVLVGAGALCREVIAAMLDMDEEQFPKHLTVCDDVRTAPLVIGGRNIWVHPTNIIAPDDLLVLTVADPTDRADMASRWVNQRLSIMAGLALCDAVVDGGAILMPGSVVSINARLGRDAIVGFNSTVGHDVHMGDFCTLSSQVDLCGNVLVGDRVFFGSGARVLPGLTIGAGAYIGAGAVVVRNVAPGERVFGNPARAIGPTT